ncbi:MAG TPA: hypothetical protein VNV37_07235, partial [Solirubrobacteraceae bacterium]|nr:hypothetical protein [Solirubrobacteraceae bacterium]
MGSVVGYRCEQAVSSAEVDAEFPLTLGELYPKVVDAREEVGGVPSRLMKTEAGDGRQEGTPMMNV